VEKKIIAVVQDIVKGRHGKYVVTTSKDVRGSITFSLRKEVWQEEKYPEPGTLVVLSGVYRKQNGWRASTARFFRPENEAKH